MINYNGVLVGILAHALQGKTINLMVSLHFATTLPPLRVYPIPVGGGVSPPCVGLPTFVGHLDHLWVAQLQWTSMRTLQLMPKQPSTLKAVQHITIQSKAGLLGENVDLDI